MPQFDTFRNSKETVRKLNLFQFLTLKTIDYPDVVKLFKKSAKPPETGVIRGLFFLRELA